jgi:hypothetical protein
MSRLSRFLPALLLIVVPALVHADPPARVGRLALVENSVNFRVDRDDQGSPASVNWPISSGALLETGRRGRSEVWVGSTAFRLAPDSQLEFPLVDDRQVVVRLNAGSLAVSVFDREQSADLTVETPEGRINFATPGRYRVDVLSDHSELTAQAGQASFDNGQRSIPVVAGQKASLYGDGQARLDPDVDHDAFDNWVAGRENAALASVSRRYVSPAMTGYQDLDAYGDWNSSAEYGAVWYPRSVDDDWAPYRFGRWAWVAPWGWTWVDQSPWGFAPFHYGRWVHVHNRWGWVPGSYVARPVYAPALVAWIGNPGWNVSFRGGAAPAVGWFPLAPREVYVPGFRASAQFVHRVNGGHVGNVGEIDRAIRSGPPHAFAYRGLPQAVTIVPSSHLSDGRPIRAGEFAAHDRRDIDRAPPARPAPDLPPPAGGRQFRDEHRQVQPARGREPDVGAPRPGLDAGRQRPGMVEQRAPDAPAAAFPRRDENRPGNFGREPAVVTPAAPQPATRAPQAWPGQSGRRSPEMPRPEAERRSPPMSVPAPAVREVEAPHRAPEVAPAVPANGERGFRPGNDRRDERQGPAFRDNPPLQPSGREAQRPAMPRQEREMPRQQEMPRQHEPAPLAPQAAPVQPMRAPAPPPAPVREMPRVEPRPQPQAQTQPAPQPAPQQRAPERRRDPKDEVGR